MSDDPSNHVLWLPSLQNLLQTQWLQHSPPRLTAGTIIGNTYKVSAVQRDGKKYQLLLAEETGNGYEEIRGRARVIKVIRPQQVGDDRAQNHIDWMRATNTTQGRSEMLCDFEYNGLLCMVFDKRPFTLKHLFDDGSLCPLSNQHVQEISLQILNAIRHIHQQFSLHGDICPETVEFLNPERTTHWVYNRETETFDKTEILCCTKVQLAYYGDFGIRTSLPGTDQYRAPEVVFGYRYTNTADIFSIGCVIAELALGEPLFPPCEEGSSLYRNEKALLYDAVSGSFTEEMAGKIEMYYPMTMDLAEIRPIQYSGISKVVERFIEGSIYIEWIFDQQDPDLAEVVGGLVRTNPRSRMSLDKTLECEYFQKHYH